MGRAALRLPTSWQFDLSLARVFRVRETHSVEFRAEAYNVLNSFRPGTINANLSSSQFGLIRTALDRESIVVHNIKAQGNAVPLRVIQGPKTHFNWPTGLAIDDQRGELYVANDMGNSILVFNVTDSGDVAPKRVIKGPKTHLANPTGIWVDLKNNEVWAANFMNHSATVYPLGASGDVAPLRIIRSGPLEEPSLGLGNPHPLAYDKGADPGSQLSGASANCGIRQVGGSKCAAGSKD